MDFTELVQLPCFLPPEFVKLHTLFGILPGAEALLKDLMSPYLSPSVSDRLRNAYCRDRIAESIGDSFIARSFGKD